LADLGSIVTFMILGASGEFQKELEKKYLPALAGGGDCRKLE